ncbi:MAG: zinc ABC transporter substrate-binding protein [Mediterranea sp.]|jgi:zinc transport system substrate-binding protein|nr:zinc ABC transporter substrate-binding protein [Mediterranea sp.]
MRQWTFGMLVLLTLAACKGNPAKSGDDDDGRPVITVTIEPLRYFTEAIAGDRFRVVSMVPKGSNPETYDPTPQQLVALHNSVAYLRVGYIGFEQVWIDRLIDNTPHLPFYDISEGVDLIYDSAHQHNGVEHLHGVEPHIWNSAYNAQVMAGNILKTLCTLDRINKGIYVQRYDSLMQHIAHVDSIVCARLSQPNADKAFLIYHPALSYFARDYGLHQIAIEENGKEPSPAYLKRLIESSKSEAVHVVFVQPEFDRRNAEMIARQTGTSVVTVNPLSYDWEEEMLHTANSLCRTTTK